ncbi:hypothetical protein PINS_up018262 [Pythium insidiosum]|nr:hypothetical protein PINS_up018262 [Pythium insidiosum]
MHFTTLSRLLLDYQLQEAGYQFCKFYEFRDGGVAPPMCGDGTQYFTLEQILQMRAWRPPVYKRSNVRALLPTRPTGGAPMAALDLDALRRGRSAFFTLPLTDLDWLKKYGWLSRVTTADDVPSVYVDAMRVYLPIHDNSSTATVGGKQPRSRCDRRVLEAAGAATDARESHVRAAAAALHVRRHVRRQRVCRLEPRRESVPSRRGCVQDDGASDLCVREWGRASTQDEYGLLPSLFSTWRVRVDLETTDGPLQLVAPDNSKAYNGSTPEFNVLVDLSLIQVGRAAAVRESAAMIDTRESATMGTCCPVNTFRATRTTCEACPAGTNSTLLGYGCV